MPDSDLVTAFVDELYQRRPSFERPPAVALFSPQYASSATAAAAATPNTMYPITGAVGRREARCRSAQ